MEQTLLALNRPTFKSKINALLQKWKIRYDDIDLDLQLIITLRNHITHTGITQSGSISPDNLFKEYTKLDVLLTRVFLSMLGYNRDYFDWVHEKWISMKDAHFQ